MPQWASRLTLTVTDVMAEPLQDIYENDARREGCMRGYTYDTGAMTPWGTFVESTTYVDAFREYWDFRRPANPWNENPWVWVISFNVTRLV